MGRFKRSLFGYSPPDVEAAIAGWDAKVVGLEGKLARASGDLAAHADETAELSGMVIEREREIRVLGERLREANECHDRSIASLDAVTERLEEMQAQARGQATRIRMKALREAVEVGRRVQELNEAEGEDAEEADAPVEPVATNGAAPANGSAPANGATPSTSNGLFEGQVKLEIGPLGDFAQLVGFEDAVGQLGASEISVERFSEGRATLSMRLEEPTELLNELEELSELDFVVRHTGPDNLILDIDEDPGPEQRAA